MALTMVSLAPPHAAPPSPALRYAMFISADRGPLLYAALAVLIGDIVP